MKNEIENRLKNWYLLLITGILFILLSLWVLFTPLASFLTLAWVISIGFVFSGISEIVYSITNRKQLPSWGWVLAGGILTLILGLHLSVRPGLTALILCFYIGFWLLFRSIMQVSNSFELKSIGVKKWGWILALGILGIIVSLVLLWNPAATSVAVSYWMGFGIFFFGLLQIVLAFGLRKIKTRIEGVRD